MEGDLSTGLSSVHIAHCMPRSGYVCICNTYPLLKTRQSRSAKYDAFLSCDVSAVDDSIHPFAFLLQQALEYPQK